MVTTLYTKLVRTRAPAGWLIKMCISVLLSTLGSPATRDPRPAGLGMLPLHGTVHLKEMIQTSIPTRSILALYGVTLSGFLPFLVSFQSTIVTSLSLISPWIQDIFTTLYWLSSSQKKTASDASCTSICFNCKARLFYLVLVFNFAPKLVIGWLFQLVRFWLGVHVWNCHIFWHKVSRKVMIGVLDITR